MFAFVVLYLVFFRTKARDLLGRTSPKRPSLFCVDWDEKP